MSAFPSESRRLTMERAMDTEQATSEKFRKLDQNKRGRLRVKAFADAVDMLSEICREHRWYGSVIRYDGECHAIEGSPEGPPPNSKAPTRLTSSERIGRVGRSWPANYVR